MPQNKALSQVLSLDHYCLLGYCYFYKSGYRRGRIFAKSSTKLSSVNDRAKQHSTDITIRWLSRSSPVDVRRYVLTRFKHEKNRSLPAVVTGSVIAILTSFIISEYASGSNSKAVKMSFKSHFNCSLLGLMNERLTVKRKDVNSVRPSVSVILVSPA